MKIPSLVFCGMLVATTAFAGRIQTVKGGDPTTIFPGSSFTVMADASGGGIDSYINGGTTAITNIVLALSVSTGSNTEYPSSFTLTQNPLVLNETADATITGFEVPPAPNAQIFYTLGVGSYIFNSVGLTYTVDFACGSSTVDLSSACLMITLSGGSIAPGQEFSFDLNNNSLTNGDINPATGTLNPNANYTGAGGFPPDSSFGATPDPSLASVPEPGTIGMLLASGIGLAGFALRKRYRA